MFRSAASRFGQTIAHAPGLDHLREFVRQEWLAPLYARVPAKPILLDAFERGFISILYGCFVYRILGSYSENDGLVLFLIIISESLPVVLIYSRSSSDTLSHNASDWVLAICGTTAPLLTDCSVASLQIPHLQQVIISLIIFGMCTQISAKVILWRSFGIVAANRGVKIGGPYRIVRHPMYAGYTVTHVGMFLAFPSLYNALLYSAALGLQIARLLREERILKQDPVYQEFAARVRYRLLPGVF